MQPQTLDQRVERLEARVTVLEQLPARIDGLTAQVLQLREEMHGEFSAIRSEICAGDEETRHSLREEIRAGDEETRRQMFNLHEELKAQMLSLHEELKAQMLSLHEELKAQMLMLHEETVSKFALLEEARGGGHGNGRKRARKRR